MKPTWKLLSCSLVVAAFLAGCADKPVVWTLHEVRTVGGFKTVECVTVDPETGKAFVSNPHALARDKVNEADRNGLISLLAPGGDAIDLKWVASTDERPIHSPKGSCLLGGYLYFNDLTELKRCRVLPKGPVEVVAAFPAGSLLNDAVTDGRDVYVSETVGGKIFCVQPSTGEVRSIPAPPRINGLTFRDGELLGVNVAAGDADIWHLDKDGVKAPERFGLAEHFVGLDSIEALEDGTLLITDVRGHRVYTVGPDDKTVRGLDIENEFPADMGIDRQRGLVYIPQFFKNEVKVYKLIKTTE